LHGVSLLAKLLEFILELFYNLDLLGKLDVQTPDLSLSINKQANVSALSLLEKNILQLLYSLDQLHRIKIVSNQLLVLLNVASESDVESLELAIFSTQALVVCQILPPFFTQRVDLSREKLGSLSLFFIATFSESLGDGLVCLEHPSLSHSQQLAIGLPLFL